MSPKAINNFICVKTKSAYPASLITIRSYHKNHPLRICRWTALLFYIKISTILARIAYFKAQGKSMEQHNTPEAQKNPESTTPQAYTVTIHPITRIEHRQGLQEAINRISETDAMLSYFYDSILHGYTEAIQLLQKLQQARVIGEEQGREHTDKSVSTYLALLTEIKREINGEKNILQELLAAQETKSIQIFEQSPESFDDFISQKIRSAKTQPKKIESSLRVSFSRYEHWIKATIARMKAIQKEVGMN
jgi:hypothetical protein